MPFNFVQLSIGLVLSSLIGWVAFRRGSLTGSGWLGAVLTGTLTFGFGGLAWGATLVLFFVSSSLLSRFKAAQKEQIAGEKFEKGGRRDLIQALANGGAGALVALLWALTGQPAWLMALFSGIMATVNADTWATELGVLSKTPPRLITTMRPVAPGTSGGVTLRGLLASAGGALLIGVGMLVFVFIETGMLVGWLIPAAVVGGIAGSLFDSLLGASVQALYRGPSGETEKRQTLSGTPYPRIRGWAWMNNDVVNFLSSVAGGLVAALVRQLF